MCEGYRIDEESVNMAGVTRVWSRFPTWPTVAPFFVGCVVAEAQSQGPPQIYKSGRALCRMRPQIDHLRQVRVGGRLLLSISEEELAAAQKSDRMAQSKLHSYAGERVLLFRNHGVVL